ncbi:Spy/CpxP family protein refolding chaperone [Afipia felis]|uniref:Domain of Uncharacterized Function (DUF1520) n=2 Tax=Afipia felis TaxID=1035 RepID=A0A380W5H1_AFIFE|nr:Spy/CpxP family protein refolding chaperone [Afipia felis]EKS31390.1 hypothetical protein HMPREF9697_03918 [Afipia felis ATCC 53690]SUU76131.1 Domain of Uncharacterised Function (DUF1520) [Afipia felis]SUU84198.1 Domain of Uncharacterised Function (DUF1520) [Afipia felis]
MKKIALAAVAALAIAGSGAAYAQHRSHHHHPHFSAQDKIAFVDARIAAVKAGLKLTPDQEKNWPAVESAVRDFAKQRIDRTEARRTERQARRAEQEGKSAEQRVPADPVARLQKRADNMAATAAGLKRIADAADPLYKSLDDGQKRRLAVLTHAGRRHGWMQHRFEREEGSPRRHFERGERGGDGETGNL